MKTITYEEVAKLYNDLKITSQPSENTKLDTSYEQITNRNFGTRDYTTSSNFSEHAVNYSKCSIDI